MPRFPFCDSPLLFPKKVILVILLFTQPNPTGCLAQDSAYWSGFQKSTVGLCLLVCTLQRRWDSLVRVTIRSPPKFDFCWKEVNRVNKISAFQVTHLHLFSSKHLFLTCEVALPQVAYLLSPVKLWEEMHIDTGKTATLCPLGIHLPVWLVML